MTGRDLQTHGMTHLFISPSDLRGCVQSHKESEPSVLADQHGQRRGRRQRRGSEGGRRHATAKCVTESPVVRCPISVIILLFLSADQSSASWEGSFPLTEEKEEEA